eukprot:368373-Prymnesium_polylepis.1
MTAPLRRKPAHAPCGSFPNAVRCQRSDSNGSRRFMPAPALRMTASTGPREPGGWGAFHRSILTTGQFGRAWGRAECTRPSRHRHSSKTSVTVYIQYRTKSGAKV